MTGGEGERREATQRRTFWTILGGLGAAGGLAGFTYGFFSSGAFKTEDVPVVAIIGAVAIMVLIFAYGTWRFFDSIDELEMVDNLFSSTVGLYVYATLFPVWWVLSRLGVTEEPNDWAIFACALISSASAYVWRKWQSR